MELLHQVLADQVGPAHLVLGVAQNWQENFLITDFKLAIEQNLMWPILIKIGSQSKNLIKAEPGSKLNLLSQFVVLSAKFGAHGLDAKLEFQIDRCALKPLLGDDWLELTYLTAGVEVGE